MSSFVKFQNGEKMPLVGLGLFMRQPADPNPVATMETTLNAALEAGYRHFDTAYFYGNEGIIGPILKRWIDSGKVKREELFITTKLPPIAMRPDLVEVFLKKSLEALQLDYVDLYLVHCPFALEYVSDKELIPMKDRKVRLDKSTDLEAIWKAMEKQVDARRAKSIGVSNFNEKQVERMVELSIYFQQKQLRSVCQKHGITVCAYGVLGSPGRKEAYEARGVQKQLPALLTDPTVENVAGKYGKSAGQILLRYLVQLGIVVIPKSANPKRIRENIDIFNFELSQPDMKLLEGLDKGEAGRSFDCDTFPGIEEHPEFPF